MRLYFLCEQLLVPNHNTLTPKHLYVVMVTMSHLRLHLGRGRLPPQRVYRPTQLSWLEARLKEGEVKARVGETVVEAETTAVAL